MTRVEYIRRFQNAVIDACKGTGLFPSVMMAQAILESSSKDGQAGESILARYFNNHFGIKAGLSWKGKRVSMKTGEVINGQTVVLGDTFRYYTNAEDSFRDRNTILRRNPSYTQAGVFAARTPEEQCDALQRGGYATSPTYANVLKKLIANYNLKSLDRLAKKKALSESA
jgi:flagellum-specific peptidoglycan hydrolase FlgJ